jgi:type IV pilus assembly protein PilC
MNYTDIKVKKKPKDLFENVALFQPKVTTKDIVIFTRQFATMIDAGLPMIQCLEVLERQETKPLFRKIITAIKEDVKSGETLADAFKKHPKQFDELYVSMVAAGEMGGVLDRILLRLAVYLEKAAKLKSRLRSAMILPGITITVAIIVVGIILGFVIPVFQDIYSSFGGNLPLSTQVVITLSHYVKNAAPFILLGLVVLYFAGSYYYRTKGGHERIDGFLLKVPLLGTLFKKTAVARFSRTLGTLLQSGVVILQSLDIVAKTAGNKVIERSIYNVRSSVAKGESMAVPLLNSAVFPPMVHQMISVGESSGTLDVMLIKVADFFDEEVEQSVENLMTALEPAIILFLGVVIGGIIISMYLPIFQLGSAI